METGDNADPVRTAWARAPRAAHNRSFPGEPDGVRGRQREAGAAERGGGRDGKARASFLRGLRASSPGPCGWRGPWDGQRPGPPPPPLPGPAASPPRARGRGWIGALRARRDRRRRWPLLGDQQRSRFGSWASGATRGRGGGRRRRFGTKKAAVRKGRRIGLVQTTSPSCLSPQTAERPGRAGRTQTVPVPRLDPSSGADPPGASLGRKAHPVETGFWAFPESVWGEVGAPWGAQSRV